MTQTNQATERELRSCPFCGKSDTLKRCRASEIFGDEDDEPYPHSESYAVVCSAEKPNGPGGCGSSGGYFPTQEEADTAWNTRASLQQVVAEPEVSGPRPWDNVPGRCWCQTCRPITLTDMRMVLCPDCGNKRCPKANDHRNACTDSNEPGQAGSAYPAAPQHQEGG